jgi:hypothetical protein
MEKHEPEKRQKYAPEINSTEADKECNGHVYAIAKTHISDRCKIQKCTRRNFREKRVAQLCEELAARQSFSLKPWSLASRGKQSNGERALHYELGHLFSWMI